MLRKIELQDFVDVLGRFAECVAAASQTVRMQLSRVSTDESTHSGGMLKDDLFNGVRDVRLRDYDFLVDMIKLLRERTTRILPVLWEGGT